MEWALGGVSTSHQSKSLIVDNKRKFQGLKEGQVLGSTYNYVIT